MKNQRMIFWMILFGFGIWISCRKMDRLVERTVNNESRFFNEHRSDEPVVQAVTQFVKGQNDKYNFVERLVKQTWLSIL